MSSGLRYRRVDDYGETLNETAYFSVGHSREFDLAYCRYNININIYRRSSSSSRCVAGIIRRVRRVNGSSVVGRWFTSTQPSSRTSKRDSRRVLVFTADFPFRRRNVPSSCFFSTHERWDRRGVRKTCM